jgi:alpha-glucosidase (family GH31 glycosyl hydrolase)
MVTRISLVFIEYYVIRIVLGAHPFHINLELSTQDQTNVHGQFFLNSNAMDVDLQPLPALTYTTIGGIIDLYIFTGPTVQNVVEQYWNIIGVRVRESDDFMSKWLF